jgi:hypothetical protein
MPSNASDGYRVDKLTVCLARASMAVLTFTVLIMMAGGSVFNLLTASSNELVPGHHAVQSTAAGSEGARVWHDRIEIVFFLSGIGLLVLGIYGLIIAKRHAQHVQEHAEHTARLSETTAQATAAMLYRNLFDKLQSQEVRDGLAICVEIEADYNSWSGRLLVPLASYAVQQIEIWKAVDQDKLRGILELLDDLEEIGLSVRSGYFLMDDVYNMFEGALKQIDAVLGLFLKNVRDDSPDHRRCEHTLWLLEKRRNGYTRTRPLAP